MKMNKILKSKWYKVRLNNNAKTFAICRTAYKTKVEASESIKSGNFVPLKFSHLQKMIAEGWTEYVKPEVEIKEAETQVEVKTDVKVAEIAKTAAVEVIKPRKTIMEETPALATKVVSKSNRSQWERLQDFILDFQKGKCELADCSKYDLNLKEVMDQIRPQKDSVRINKSKIIKTKHPRVNRKVKAADTSFLGVFDNSNHVSALN